MRSLNFLKSFMFLTFVALAVVAFADAPAYAIDSPGLQIKIGYQPDYIQFPASYEQSDPEIYQAHLALLKYPEMLRALTVEQEKKEAEILSDSSLNMVAKRERLDALKADCDVRRAELNKEQSQMRTAYLILARERLRSDVDPYILFFMAQVYYPIRGQAPEITQKELVAAIKAKEEAEKAADGDNDAEKAEAGEGAAVEAAPKPKVTAGGSPSMAVVQEYNSNYERIVAALDEIRQRFASFEHMDKVVRYLAVIKSEMGQSKESIKLIRAFLKDYKSSPYRGEMLFRLAEWQFETPFAFDHHSLAVETYMDALKLYPDPGKRHWRIMYKMAWAQYLSPDMSADALDTFVKLYKKIEAQPAKTLEMMAIQAEVIEVIKQIKAVEHSSGGGSTFGQ